MTAPRRALGEMLAEVAGDSLGALAGAPSLRVRRFALSLPVEIGLRGTELVGDVPRSVFRTDFDLEPGRLEVVWIAGEGA